MRVRWAFFVVDGPPVQRMRSDIPVYLRTACTVAQIEPCRRRRLPSADAQEAGSPDGVNVSNAAFTRQQFWNYAWAVSRGMLIAQLEARLMLAELDRSPRCRSELAAIEKEATAKGVRPDSAKGGIGFA